MARSLLLGWMLFAVVAHHMSNDQQNLKKLHQRWLASASSTEDGCVLAEECKLCDAALRSEITECRETGRVEIWKCSNDAEDSNNNNNDSTTTSTTTTTVSASVGVGPLYRSCLRTKSDEEFLMVRLQVIWVVLGTAAFVLSRKQKSLSASLFDQRKLASQQAAQQQQSTTNNIGQKKRRTSAYNTSSSALTHENNIEMTKIEQQETMPLTMDAVDVV
ncbi:expressed unknown protein [Seminavis robusta]|uniref:Uncharacterized protein n=1 Tax=Seminavis robusta TaxID=568900 RepID=A0A9N8E5Q1_9STRA|nr:expressed unknown protein [Seminavis robusta]|eukprot:Sro525_g160240.1 n/a (218) ;mRNA; f:60134-60890